MKKTTRKQQETEPVNELETINSVTNDAEEIIEHSCPYTVVCTIQGNADILFHRWSDDGVAAKAAAAKGSKAKRTDDVDSYIYRHPITGNIAVPGEYFRNSIIGSARFYADPRSPRKSAQDIFKAGLVSLTAFADTGLKTWDYLDRRRVLVQRNAITRVRPALKAGWKLTFELTSILPEYIPSSLLHQVTTRAGQVIGIADFRPTYGRYGIIGWKVRNN